MYSKRLTWEYSLIYFRHFVFYGIALRVINYESKNCVHEEHHQALIKNSFDSSIIKGDVRSFYQLCFVNMSIKIYCIVKQNEKKTHNIQTFCKILLKRVHPILIDSNVDWHQQSIFRYRQLLETGIRITRILLRSEKVFQK